MNFYLLSSVYMQLKKIFSRSIIYNLGKHCGDESLGVAGVRMVKEELGAIGEWGEKIAWKATMKLVIPTSTREVIFFLFKELGFLEKMFSKIF